MKVKDISKCTILIAAIILNLSTESIANETVKKTPVTIPQLEDAQVFSDFTDETPAVLNYFTLSTKKQVIAFYSLHFGEPVFQEIKQNYLTLIYQKAQQTVRIVISERSNKRQVDIIIESNKS
jgi:hypothetical protein